MPNPASSGDRDVRIRFDKPGEVPDPFGGTVPGWVDQFSRLARIIPAKGGEGVQAQRLAGTQPVYIIVEWDSSTRTIETSWRAVEILNGVEIAYYAIKTSADMERERRNWTIFAVQGGPDGGAG